MPTRDPTAWMWAEACQMLEQAERMHRQFFRLGSPRGARTVWEPPVAVLVNTNVRLSEPSVVGVKLMTTARVFPGALG